MDDDGDDEFLWLELSFENPECPFITTTADYDGLKVSYVKGFEGQEGHTYRVEIEGDSEGVKSFIDEIEEAEGCTYVDTIADAESQALCQGSFTGATCIREELNQLGVTAEEIETRGGRGYVGTHLNDHRDLQKVLKNLDNLPDVRLEDVRRQSMELSWPKNVFVESFGLTEKQYRVMEKAYEMGYFDAPREVNATAVTEELDITISTIMDHLQKALSKMTDHYFKGMPQEIDEEVAK